MGRYWGLGRGVVLEQRRPAGEYLSGSELGLIAPSRASVSPLFGRLPFL